jgi:hypothetical protein
MKPLLKAFPGEINKSVSGKEYKSEKTKKKKKNRKALHFRLLSVRSEIKITRDKNISCKLKHIAKYIILELIYST